VVTDRYTLISADCHAGASHATYREYLDPKYLDDFDAWRGKYKNPFKDLKNNDLRVRNWDDELRWEQQESDGTVAEVVFPNTVPPFFPSFVLFAGPPRPDEYEHRLAGIRAHNRWAADFQAAYPDRRAVLGQVFLNDLDDAVADAVWIKEHGLKGGVLIPNIPPNTDWVKPLYHPDLDRFWKVCEDLELIVTTHSGTGSPDYGDFPFSGLLQAIEIPFYSQRPLVQLMISGVFERFPRLKYVITELGARWVPGLLDTLEIFMGAVRAGQLGEFRYEEGQAPAKTAMEYFHQNCWVGVSMAGPEDVAVRDTVGIDRFMWGSDYPHDEGTYPDTTKSLRRAFREIPQEETRKMLAGNAAALYGFDLDKLAPLAAEHGPLVEDVHRPRAS